MRIAVVGSRNFKSATAIERAIQELKDLHGSFVLVSGGARGVDTIAERAAKRLGLELEIHKPDYTTHGKRAPLVRNEEIARRCDRMLAFWDGVSTGTMHVTAYAKSIGKPVEIRLEAPDEVLR